MLIRCVVSTTACASRAFVKERVGIRRRRRAQGRSGTLWDLLLVYAVRPALRLRNADITPDMRGCEEGAARNEEGEGAALDWVFDRNAAGACTMRVERAPDFQLSACPSSAQPLHEVPCLVTGGVQWGG
eukprot:5760082-Pyramimonas_sp.AAC.1